MYRRLESSLPPDFIIPADLKSMGYFLNENDQIRMIDDPDEPFNYFASKNERFVEMQKEAMNQCCRNIILERLANLNIGAVPLPITAKPDEPHIPILVSNNYKTASRIVVYIGENTQDLGLFAGRILNLESINRGSAVSFAHDVLTDSAVGPDYVPLEKRGLKRLEAMGDTAIVLANPGQLIWWRRGKKAMTYYSWNAVPRKYGCADGPMLSIKNRVTRNRDSVEHVQCLFDDFLAPLAEKGVKIDIIAVADAMESVTNTLDSEWAKWSKAVQAVVVCAHGIYDLEIRDDDFRKFWGKRARAYVVDHETPGCPMTGRHLLGCNVYSSGVSDFIECIMPRSYDIYLDYFKLVDRNPDYENVPQDFSEPEAEPGPLSWGVDAAEDINIDVSVDTIEEETASESQTEEHAKVAGLT